MKKFKRFLTLSLLSLFSFGLFAITTVVNAETVNYGTVVADASNSKNKAGDTKKWDFTSNLPAKNAKISVGNDVNGIINAKNGSSETQVNKSSSNAFQTFNGAVILIPVPSGSAGTLTRTGNNGVSNERTLTLNGATDDTQDLGTNSFTFTSNDIKINPEIVSGTTYNGTFLQLTTATTKSGDTGEAKTTSFEIVLTTGTFNSDVKTVTFVYGNGTNNSSVFVDKGNKVSEPSSEPTWASHDFLGWYTSDDNGVTLSANPYDFDSEVDGDLTLYANWKEITTYEVIFNSMGGSSVDTQYVVDGEKAVVPADPTKHSYEFKGWYTSDDNGVTLSANPFDFDTVLTGALTLYAKWEEVTLITATFKVDGIEYATKEVVDGKNGNLISDWPSNPSSPEYTTFDGWYTANKVRYTSTTAINSDVTLYAKFSGIKSTMTYMADDLSSRDFSSTNANGMNYGNLTINAGGFSKYTSSSASYSDGTSASNALQASSFTIRIVKAGTLKIYATQTSSQSRTFSVKNSSDTEIYSYQPSSKGASNANVGVVELTPGLYTIVGNPTSNETGNKPMNVAGFKFVADADSANLTVTAAQQETDVIDGYRYVRFVYIIDGANVPESALNNKMTLVLDEGTANQQAIDVTPNCVRKITNGSSTYSANVPGLGSYEFSAKENVTYVVYVVKFTNSKYITHTISSTLDYNGSTYNTTPYTFTA